MASHTDRYAQRERPYDRVSQYHETCCRIVSTE
jgi:hypothetical protein